MSKCPVPEIACYLLRSKWVDTVRVPLGIGKQLQGASPGHDDQQRKNCRTELLRQAGMRNRQKPMAAKNANHKYHRRKTGRRLANNSQRPAGKCKGMSHKGCNLSCNTQRRVQKERPRIKVPRRPRIIKTNAVGHLECPFLRNNQKENQKIPPLRKYADRSQENGDPGQSSCREDLFLFRSQVLLSVFAGLHRAFQICGQETRFSRARPVDRSSLPSAGRPQARPKASE